MSTASGRALLHFFGCEGLAARNYRCSATTAAAEVHKFRKLLCAHTFAFSLPQPGDGCYKGQPYRHVHLTR